jgi:purine-nucleoside phosphorylase
MTSSVPTPHNAAKVGDIAKSVLMPGDPLRAKFIAENFLENAKQFNGVRGMLGFTGTYKGKPVSVMGSGMGMPSIGIYCYELYAFYEVENIIRIGTAGGMAQGMKLRDVVIAQGASTNSNFAHQYNLPGTFAPIATYKLLSKAVEFAEVETKKDNCKLWVGNVLSGDVFYNDSKDTTSWRKMGILAGEMETAALYMTAARLGKSALGMFTISDMMTVNDKGDVIAEQTTSEERQTAFTTMMKIALETVHAVS